MFSSYQSTSALDSNKTFDLFAAPSDFAKQLRSKLVSLEAIQDRMRRVNFLVRTNNIKALKAMGYTESQITRLMQPNCFKTRAFFPDYKLRNTHGKIRALRLQLRKLESDAASTTVNIRGENYTYSVDTAKGRVSFLFLTSPDKQTHAELCRQGFIHSPSQNLYDRQLCATAILAGQRMRDYLEK